jgi:hypothetical protein
MALLPVREVQRNVAVINLRLNVRSSNLALAEDSSCAIAIVGAHQLVDNDQMALKSAARIQRKRCKIVKLNATIQEERSEAGFRSNGVDSLKVFGKTELVSCTTCTVVYLFTSTEVSTSFSIYCN